MGLIVLAESDPNKTLLVHKIKPDSADGDVYQRAGGALTVSLPVPNSPSNAPLSLNLLPG